MEGLSFSEKKKGRGIEGKWNAGKELGGGRGRETVIRQENN